MSALRSHTFHAIQRFAERALVVEQKTHHDGRKHQCFTPQKESMLTEAKCYCAKTVDGHFLVRTTPLQIEPQKKKPEPSNTADILQSTNGIHVHHGIHILPQGQRGTRTEPDTSTCFDSKRQTATQEKKTRKPTGNGWLGQSRNYWKNPTCLCIFQKKCLIPLDKGLITLDTLYACLLRNLPQTLFPLVLLWMRPAKSTPQKVNRM